MLSIIGLIVIIIIAVFTFRTAKENGRKAGIWMTLVVVVGIVIQIVIPIIVAIVAVTYKAMTGSPQAELINYDPLWLTYFSIFCILAGVAVNIIILRYVSRLPDDDNYNSPPSPDKFNLNS